MTFTRFTEIVGYIGIGSFLLFILVTVFGTSSPRDPLTNARFECQMYLKTQVNDPASLEITLEYPDHNRYVMPRGDGGYDIILHFSVKNGFGGRIQNEYACIEDSKFNILKAQFAY